VKPAFLTDCAIGNNKPRFAEELRKAGASEKVVEILMHHYPRLENGILAGRFVVSQHN
jgi:hypothetical protein